MTPHESWGNMIINSIRNTVRDFFLFCWTWSTQTQLENKSALWSALKASLDLRSVFEGKSLDADRQGMHMQSQWEPVRNVLQTARRHRSQIHYWIVLGVKQVHLYRQMLWRAVDHHTSFQPVPQFRKTSRSLHQLTLMQLFTRAQSNTGYML